MNDLKGKVILDIYVSDDREDMQFVTTQGPQFFSVDGDCCSQSYFYEVNSPENILGKQVSDVQELDLPDPDDEDSQKGDVVVAYGIRLISVDGLHTDIVFRNDSNGYYGGWCSASGPPATSKGWHHVTEDWQG